MRSGEGEEVEGIEKIEAEVEEVVIEEAGVEGGRVITGEAETTIEVEEGIEIVREGEETVIGGAGKQVIEVEEVVTEEREVVTEGAEAMIEEGEGGTMSKPGEGREARERRKGKRLR